MEEIFKGKEKYTPMMQQYLDIKKDYADAIVFFRLGDFYEMFFEDAYLASRELEIVLTGRDAGVSDKVPMCGVPFHAYATYAQKLIEKGYKVAIVEQVEDFSLAKGIVKREVVKLITPGTMMENLMGENENNFIASIGKTKSEYILCYCDVSTGESYLSTYSSIDLLAGEVISFKIKEIISSKNFEHKIIGMLKDEYKIMISYEDDKPIPQNLIYVTEEIDDSYLSTAAILINYIIDTLMKDVTHLKKIKLLKSGDYLKMDSFTKKNLELTETMRNSNKIGSLLAHIDHCQTAMGSRMIRHWIEKPLLRIPEIEERLDFVNEFYNDYIVKEDVKNALRGVYDIERILGRISCGNTNAKDLVQLRKSLSNIYNLKIELKKLKLKEASEFADLIDPHQDLFNLLNISLVDNPPLTIKEGGMILEGYDSELDEYKNISKTGKDWIVEYEQKERLRLGIKTLKVGYNRVFGYYVEVSKGQVASIPADSNYERRQTIANSERFISPELKVYEQKVLNAKDKIEIIEYELFTKIRSEAEKYIQSLQILADKISTIDCYITLAEVAKKNNYVRPTFSDIREVNIVDGRHPVVESIIKDDYVKNDIIINKYNMVIITGPNMSGKSTYMRMLAIIVVMAQLGSFVPAKSATLPIFDQIFTRIGATDDLMSGQSTFMVEMIEANYAITNATKSSLILFDELGRGTATFDGMALAQAILEYVHDKIGCITLFSTHYHELVQLEKKLKNLKNIHVEAKETKDGVAFLHKVKDGPIDKSYGINVAKLASLPRSLIERSKIILNSLEASSNQNGINLDLFSFDEFENQKVVKEEEIALKLKKKIDDIDINKLTPLEALNILYELKSDIEE